MKHNDTQNVPPPFVFFVENGRYKHDPDAPSARPTLEEELPRIVARINGDPKNARQPGTTLAATVPMIRAEVIKIRDLPRGKDAIRDELRVLTTKGVLIEAKAKGRAQSHVWGCS